MKRFLVKIGVAVICTMMCVGSGIIVRKFYYYEKAQEEQIAQLNADISKLSGEMAILRSTLRETLPSVEWNENGYNYLAIGNSITVHGLASYWWDDDRGMASTCDENDYVHRIKNYLEYNNVTLNVYNFSTWETVGTDRAEFLELLMPYLSTKIDLITIQLGENAQDLVTWESDFEELITYIKGKAPEAEIVVIGDFWSNKNRDELKKQAAVACGVKYVSLDGIKDNDDYYAGMGTEVEDSDGNIHLIDHSGVAIHPGDRGMEEIAKRVIEILE